MNTRLQVEHGVTEEVGGVDLVEWMIRTAAGDAAAICARRAQAARPRDPGARLCRRSGAQLPARERLADRGRVAPTDARVDGWVETGTEVSAYYDPMLAKMIARGATREQAIAQSAARARARRASTASRPTCPTCASILANRPFAAGEQTTRMLGHIRWRAAAHRSAERRHADHGAGLAGAPGLVGRGRAAFGSDGSAGAAARATAWWAMPPAPPALEMTVTGPTLRFDTDAVIALAGATAGRDARWCAGARSGSRSRCRAAACCARRDPRRRAARLSAPCEAASTCREYLGSRATFTLGQFGGHGGRALRAGDVLRLAARDADARRLPAPIAARERPSTRTLADRGD